METVKHDLVIVGGGPAGLSAAIYAQRSLLDTVVMERLTTGGQIVLTSEIDNYPGVPHADAFSLADAMRNQASDLGANIISEAVVRIKRNGASGRFIVTGTERAYDAAAVIVAAGAQPRHAGFEGEEHFTGRGVSYCATCDGMFYRDKHVFVIGGGNSAAEEALFLARLASKVSVVVRKDHLRAQASLVRALEENERVELRLLTSIVAVDGEGLVSSVTLRNNVTGDTFVETFDEGSVGVFVLVGRAPETGLLEGLCELDAVGYAITDDRMATSVPGLFVAGDARAKPLRQIVTAASDGAVAATSAAAYLGCPIDS